MHTQFLHQPCQPEQDWIYCPNIYIYYCEFEPRKTQKIIQPTCKLYTCIHIFLKCRFESFPSKCFARIVLHLTCQTELEYYELEIIATGVRPEIRQSTIYYAGLLGRWSIRIVDQASDVPSIICFMISCKILCKNPCNLFSYFFIQLQK